MSYILNLKYGTGGKGGDRGQKKSILYTCLILMYVQPWQRDDQLLLLSHWVPLVQSLRKIASGQHVRSKRVL